MAAVENEDKLREYLKQVTTSLRRTRKTVVAESLDSSSDEEVFDFIGKALGIH